MNYLIAFIAAVAATCVLVVKGGDRFNDYNNEEEE